MLTEENKKKYVERPFNCPFCDSEKIKGDEPEITDFIVYRKVECVDCGKVWEERFDLVGIEEVEQE